MSMQEIAVGDEVVRIKGEKYQIGAKGKVVEISGERLRVYWHTGHTAPKRTWVNRSVIARA